jgi:hypothetical protein
MKFASLATSVCVALVTVQVSVRGEAELHVKQANLLLIRSGSGRFWSAAR